MRTFSLAEQEKRKKDDRFVLADKFSWKNKGRAQYRRLKKTASIYEF